MKGASLVEALLRLSVASYSAVGLVASGVGLPDELHEAYRAVVDRTGDPDQPTAHEHALSRLRYLAARPVGNPTVRA